MGNHIINNRRPLLLLVQILGLQEVFESRIPNSRATPIWTEAVQPSPLSNHRASTQANYDLTKEERALTKTPVIPKASVPNKTALEVQATAAETWIKNNNSETRVESAARQVAPDHILNQMALHQLLHQSINQNQITGKQYKGHPNDLLLSV